MAEATKPFSPDNEKHVKSRKRQAEREALEISDAWRWVMSDKRGRLAMRQLIKSSKLEPFSLNSSATDYNCGLQFVGMKLAKDLETDFPKEFLLMEAERLQAAIDAKQQDEANRTESNNNGVEE